MSISLSAITNLLPGNVPTAPTPAFTSADTDTGQFTVKPIDEFVAASAKKAETSDNILNSDPKSTPPTNESIQNTTSDYHQKMASDELNKSQQNTESTAQASRREGQGPSAEQPAVVQLWHAQYSQNIETGKNGVATRMQPRAGLDLAQMLAELRLAGATTRNNGSAKIPPGLAVASAKTGKPELTDTASNLPKNPLWETSQASNAAAQPQNKTSASITNAQKSDSDKNSNGREAAAAQKAAVAAERKAPTEKPPISTYPKENFFTVKNGQVPVNGQSPSHKEAQINPKESGATEKPATQNTAASQNIRTDKLQNAGKEQTGNTAGDSLFKNLNAEQVKVSIGDKEKTNSTSSRRSDTGSQNAEPANLQNALNRTGLEQQPPAAAAAKTNAGNTTGNAATGVKEQVQESVYSSLQQGKNEITVRLNPPDLGKVFIKFQQEAGELTGLLEVSKQQTRIEIQQALPEIIRNLQEAGVNVKRLEVELADQQANQADRQALFQDSSPDHHDFAEQQTQNSTSVRQWLTGRFSYQASPDARAYITDGSINVLA
jgi:flagellar hook-length control protein FliK